MSVELKSLKFRADAQLICADTPAPDDISFDVTITEHFNRSEEGVISLGMVPNQQELESRLVRTADEEYLLKPSGSDVFTLPEGGEILRPAIELAAAYEAKYSRRFLQKTAALIVRDHTFYTNKPQPKLHRDPPNPIRGSMQNVYSFASVLPTEYPYAKTSPKPFEMVCFTSGTPHRTPAITLRTPSQPLRRLFVAIAFEYIPPALQEKMIQPRLNWRPVSLKGEKPFNPYAKIGYGS